LFLVIIIIIIIIIIRPIIITRNTVLVQDWCSNANCKQQNPTRPWWLWRPQ